MSNPGEGAGNVGVANLILRRGQPALHELAVIVGELREDLGDTARRAFDDFGRVERVE
jgi:hypothetical protein